MNCSTVATMAVTMMTPRNATPAYRAASVGEGASGLE